jgi:hypothetical protein
MKSHHLFLAGLILLGFGTIIRLRIGRRRFRRRTLTGLQRFPTYENSLVTRAGEGCAGVVGALFLLAGLLLTLAGLA